MTFTFHLQYKHSGTFANRNCEELSYPQTPKMYDPILVTLLKMELHYSQSSRENATPSSGTSPLASYKELAHGTTAPLNIFATTFTKFHLAFRQPTSKLLEGWVGKKPSSTTPTLSAYLQLARFQDGFAN